MKAVILAGGLGTRLSEETSLKPKPMVEIGGKPILWHIMKIFSAHGITDFVVCLGYRGYMIKEYFANYMLHMSDVTINMRDNDVAVHHQHAEPWSVTLVDTGETSMTGGRLLRVSAYLETEEDFCFTYGDGLTDAPILDEIRYHKEHGKLATVLAVRPPGRYGALEISNGRVESFSEKPQGDGGYINGGFFVLNQRCLSYIESDQTSWESDSLVAIANQGELVPFTHDGFWMPMDTLRERNELESLWTSGSPPWKCW